jgi:hypothetical protein
VPAFAIEGTVSYGAGLADSRTDRARLKRLLARPPLASIAPRGLARSEPSGHSQAGQPQIEPELRDGSRRLKRGARDVP